MSTVANQRRSWRAVGDDGYRWVTNWAEYVQRLKHFFLANNITDEGKQRSILLSVCGAKTYKLIRNLATLQRPGDIGFKDLATMVQNPKPSVIVQRLKFHTHSRKPGVTVAAFVA